MLHTWLINKNAMRHKANVRMFSFSIQSTNPSPPAAFVCARHAGRWLRFDFCFTYLRILSCLLQKSALCNLTTAFLQIPPANGTRSRMRSYFASSLSGEPLPPDRNENCSQEILPHRSRLFYRVSAFLQRDTEIFLHKTEVKD